MNAWVRRVMRIGYVLGYGAARRISSRMNAGAVG
jgi:hypothetical protein